MDWHNLKKEEVLREIRSSENGLKSSEANSRLKKYGANELRKIKGKSLFRIFLSQFKSLLILILLVAGIVSFLIGHVLDGIVIGVIVLLNALIGFVQEYKAERIIERLRKSLDYSVIVMRDGKQQEIKSKFLVPGDIVILREGNKVLADCRILEQENLQINEAVLTGESFPVEKSEEVSGGDVVLAERKNMLYAGTSVIMGNCIAVVVETGKKTEFGKLAELVQITESAKTPLEKKVDLFSRKVAFVILCLVVLIFIIGVWAGFDVLEMFFISVSLAIGAIPEGLPAVIAITLAFAIKRMYKINTLIRRLPAAETLGRATVICTDKTGTLTEEKLTVDEVYAGKLFVIGKLKKLSKDLRQILKIGILCNNARDEGEKILGDPTEVALVKNGKRFNFDKKLLTEVNHRVKEFVFSSERKMMSVVRKDGKIYTSYVKGAGSFILNRCTKELANGKIKLLTKKRKLELEKVYLKMEQRGLRVLGFAFRQISSRSINQSEAENHLILSGFIGMIDPPRKEVREAISECLNAGIEVKIITGDSGRTTMAIAKKIGLVGEFISGKELNKLTEKQFTDTVKQKTIFARVTPQQKLKIVEFLKKQKQVVAVTGDGVNDILALKKADVGVSMGMRGSDVARDSSDVVLLDDNFASIVKAVKQGRRVFANLKKSIKFLLAANVGEVFIVLFALLLKWPLPLLPLALLWLNLVTDSLPALALAIEPAEEDIMRHKPSGKNLLQGIWSWILIAGILNVVFGLLVFNFAIEAYGLDVARTMCLTVIVFFELFFVWSCKSSKSLFKTGILNNLWLIWAVLISAGLHLVALYTPLALVFKFVALDLTQLGICVGAGAFGLVVFEVWKLVWLCKKSFKKDCY